MYHFARLLTLQGDQRETTAWAMEVTAHVNTLTDVDITLWQAEFGYPVGTFGWSTIVEGRAHLAAETAKIADGGDAYFDLVAKAQEWVTGPAEDVFRSFVHGGPGDDRPEVGAVASVTEAVAATGKMPEAMAWAVDMAEHASSVIDLPVMVELNAYGPFGGMAFLTVSPDHATVDAQVDVVRNDTGYMEKIAASAGLFVEGSAHQALMTRIA